MLTIWLSFLPFSLWDACHWWTVPVTGLVAYLLLGEPLLGIFEACQTRVLGHMPRELLRFCALRSCCCMAGYVIMRGLVD